ncbi:hypothetical protein JR316_0007873 [Psilocybe cubensis]|uniref:Uncharacterized protein n=2 Tax=Psilocybe cubensis TaxID=181762 RepID=A0A8H7XV45_PSICU|nr:hypothetical protein JR316_0007873 [Psilocybe cubensis]KAH9479285.1 hypothetical protein JR316_0007873 [Psilocybe cubensis]
MFKIITSFIALALFLEGACAAPILNVVPNTSAAGVQTDDTAVGTTRTANILLNEYFPSEFGLTSREDDVVDVEAGDSTTPAGFGVSNDVINGLPVIGGSGTSGTSDTGLGGFSGILGGLTGGLGLSSVTSGLGSMGLPLGGSLPGVSGVTGESYLLQLQNEAREFNKQSPGALGGVTSGLPAMGSLSDLPGLVKSEDASIA